MVVEGKRGTERGIGRVACRVSPDAACAMRDGAGDRPAGAVREYRAEGDRRRLHRVLAAVHAVHGDLSAEERMKSLDSESKVAALEARRRDAHSQARDLFTARPAVAARP